MPQYHGARGQALVEYDTGTPPVGGPGYEDAKIIFNVFSWNLNVEHQLEDTTKLAGAIGTPAAGILFHEYGDIGGRYTGTLEGRLDDAAGNAIDESQLWSDEVRLQFSLMDGQGNTWVGKGVVNSHRVGNSRDAMSTISCEFTGTDDLTVS